MTFITREGRILGKTQRRTSVGGKGIVLSSSPRSSHWITLLGLQAPPMRPVLNSHITAPLRWLHVWVPKCHCQEEAPEGGGSAQKLQTGGIATF